MENQCMSKYILVTWPEIQDYMEHPDYPSKVFIGHTITDSSKMVGVVNDVWFVPEKMYHE